MPAYAFHLLHSKKTPKNCIQVVVSIKQAVKQSPLRGEQALSLERGEVACLLPVTCGGNTTLSEPAVTRRCLSGHPGGARRTRGRGKVTARPPAATLRARLPGAARPPRAPHLSPAPPAPSKAGSAPGRPSSPARDSHATPPRRPRAPSRAAPRTPLGDPARSRSCPRPAAPRAPHHDHRPGARRRGSPAGAATPDT